MNNEQKRIKKALSKQKWDKTTETRSVTIDGTTWIEFWATGSIYPAPKAI